MLRRRDRLAVLVSAQERGIERVAREVEIVGVAAELRRLGLGRPDDPDVAIFVIGVELVLAAAVQRHDLAALDLGVGAARFFDPRDGGGLGLDRGQPGRAADRAFDVAGDVADRGDHLGLLARAQPLVGPRRGGEAVLEVIDLGGRQVLQAVGDAMVVGEDQAVARNEAGRAAAGQPHRRRADLVEPRLVGRPAIIGAHLRRGEGVEGPHALVGVGGRDRQGQHREKSGAACE